MKYYNTSALFHSAKDTNDSLTIDKLLNTPLCNSSSLSNCSSPTPTPQMFVFTQINISKHFLSLNVYCLDSYIH